MLAPMPPAPRSDHRGFRPVEVGRSHEFVAEQIRRQITLRLIPPNGSLPPERELARMLGVGRATLQEAIRLLEEEGLLTTRRGRSGGTFVLGPTGGEASVAALVPKLRREAHLIEEALDYRLAIEPPAAALAARSDDAEDRAALRRAHEEGLIEDGNAEVLAKDTDFHLIIGRMSQNHFLAEGIEAARLTLGDALFALPESQRWGARSSHEHRAILAAIEGGDESAARAAMREHVRNTDGAIRALLRAL
jgi:GntR family transcriptional regulator, transcriptional repressor for pyruvate dehydrogenase complex